MPQAELIITNARILTMNPDHTHAEAVAVSNGRISRGR